MQKLAEIMLEYWDAPWFATLRGFLIGALVVCVIWVVCELHALREHAKEDEDGQRTGD
jgi:hypothetical protein